MKVGMLYMKLKQMEHRPPCKHIFCPYTHPQPQDEVKNVKKKFLKVVMLHIKLKGMGGRGLCKHIFCPYTHPAPLGVWSKGQKYFTETRHVAYQIKRNGT